MTDLFAALRLLALASSSTVAQCLTRRQARPAASGDTGLSTLEIVVIALGLFLIAGVLVAAITAAVTSRLSQIA